MYSRWSGRPWQQIVHETHFGLFQSSNSSTTALARAVPTAELQPVVKYHWNKYTPCTTWDHSLDPGSGSSYHPYPRSRRLCPGRHPIPFSKRHSTFLLVLHLGRVTCSFGEHDDVAVIHHCGRALHATVPVRDRERSKYMHREGMPISRDRRCPSSYVCRPVKIWSWCLCLTKDCQGCQLLWCRIIFVS